MSALFEDIPVIKISGQPGQNPLIPGFEAFQMSGGNNIQTGLKPVLLVYFGNSVKRFFEPVIKAEG